MDSSNPRATALQVVLKVVAGGRSLDDVFNSDWLRGQPLERRDLALCRELSFGLCRWYHALGGILAQRLQKPLRARDRDIEIILLMGLYQLMVMRVERHAAVNETVDLARTQGKHWARGLINAVLRGVLRDGVQLSDIDQQQSYPDWMIGRIRRDWGERAGFILGCGNERPPMTLRVDTRQISVDALIGRLEEQDIAASPHNRVDSAVELDYPCDVSLIPGFAEGKVSVQDASAQLAAELLECPQGAHVLDACAAPGGKTAHLLQRYTDIELDALDKSEVRLQKVAQNLRRIGRSARLLVGDAARPADWFDGHAYDCILVDAPCSASGVIRRHPDIKLLRRESDIMPLLEQQRKILDAAWRLLKPGGQMLYCTCSVFKDENEIQIGKFLQRHPDAVEDEIDPVVWGEARPHGRQILTGSADMDGFYYALLTKSPAA